MEEYDVWQVPFDCSKGDYGYSMKANLKGCCVAWSREGNHRFRMATQKLWMLRMMVDLLGVVG